MAKPSTSLLKRRLDIAEIVRKNGEIKVDDLAQMLAVSGVTIRNDLNYLEQQGYLKRSFGGAIYTAQRASPVAQSWASVAVTDKTLEAEMARQAAALIGEDETVFLGPGSILLKVIPFLAVHGDLRLLMNDLAHVCFAQEFLSGEKTLLGGVLSRDGNRSEGEVALNALCHYRPARTLIAVDHIAEDGTLSVRDAESARLLGEAVEQSKHFIALVASRPVYGEKRCAVGQLAQASGLVTPQVVAAEYHSRFLAAGLTNSYTNNECLTWLNPTMQKAQ